MKCVITEEILKTTDYSDTSATKACAIITAVKNAGYPYKKGDYCKFHNKPSVVGNPNLGCDVVALYVKHAPENIPFFIHDQNYICPDLPLKFEL